MAQLAALLQCSNERLETEARLHCLARQEVALVREAQQHEDEYRRKETAEVRCAPLARQLRIATWIVQCYQHSGCLEHRLEQGYGVG